MPNSIPVLRSLPHRETRVQHFTRAVLGVNACGRKPPKAGRGGNLFEIGRGHFPAQPKRRKGECTEQQGCDVPQGAKPGGFALP